MWLGSSVILPKMVSSQEVRSSFKFESRGRKRVNFESSGSKGWKGCWSWRDGCRFSGVRSFKIRRLSSTMRVIVR